MAFGKGLGLSRTPGNQSSVADLKHRSGSAGDGFDTHRPVQLHSDRGLNFYLDSQLTL